MIFDEVVLHNVGPFRSRNVLQLSPNESGRPVTLIGGLNGNGKTTLLDSIHLCLYGRQASFCRSSAIPYEEQLRRLINRGVKSENGAAVEVAFRSIEGGTQRGFRVKRIWNAPRDRVREHVEIEVDGVREPGLSDSWADEVLRFLPPTLADLFFFDGERIEGFADPARSGVLLASAVHSLLGVDLVQQLAADLDVLTRRRLKRTVQTNVRPELDAIESQLSALRSRRDSLLQEEAACRATAGQAESKVRTLSERLGASTEEATTKRRELEDGRAALQAQLDGVGQAMTELAAGCLPLALLRVKLEALLVEGTVEVNYRRQAALSDVLEERDQAVTRGLRRGGVPAGVVKTVEQLLADDRIGRAVSLPGRPLLGIDEALAHELNAVVRKRLPEQVSVGAGLLSRHSSQSEAVDEIERRLAVAPTEQDAKSAWTTLEAARQRYYEADRLLQRAEAERLSVDAEIQRLRERERALADQQRQEDEASQDATRFARFATRGQEMLALYRVKLVEQRVSKLESHILEGFRQLMRKDSLIDAVRIDADTCHLHLVSADGSELHAARLSAGERQLLATAILWGLARASGRPVPVVIDTPLGRLDSKHRELLVDRYFPNASHQVILLSTDEEIDSHLVERLRPSIDRMYKLVHDDRSGATSIQPGYFW